MTDNLPTVVSNETGLKSLLESNKDKIATSLPKHITPESIMKQALNAAMNNPSLWRCTKDSWIQSLLRASELGLDCSGTLGQAYIIPYGNQATFMIGYRGMIDLVRRTGKVSSISAHPVYEHDKFKCVFGTETVLEHEPKITGNRGKVIAYYMVAVLTDGSKQIEVMTSEEVEAIRQRSKAKNSGPWQSDPVEMGRKTVFRRGFKWLPSSPELEKAVQYDDEATGLDMANTIEIKAEPGVNGLVKALEQKKQVEDKPKEEEPEPADDFLDEPPKEDKPKEEEEPERMTVVDVQRVINYCEKHNMLVKEVQAEICKQIGYEEMTDIPKSKGKQINKILQALGKNAEYKDAKQ